MDSRRAYRKRTFIGAKILLNEGSSALDCVVKDLSDGSARQEPPPGRLGPERLRYVA